MNDSEAGCSETDVRLELKAVVAQHELYRVRTWLDLHPMAFRRRYASRMVNNVYFDTVDLTSYVENLQGDCRRAKVRLRWYGPKRVVVEDGVFEVKLKRNVFGHKLLQCLSSRYDLQAVSWSELITELRTDLASSLRSYLDAAPMPVLINCYEREYFSSFDDSMRVTFDYNIVAFDQRRSSAPNVAVRLPSPQTAVVEVKATREHDRRLHEVVRDFPTRFTRSSKYADAVESSLSY